MSADSSNVMNINLNQHAVVEASAGTGKTHTIENLVIRILTETAVPLEQILIVTFTEKATGDLKMRLRGALERELQKDSECAAVLQAAVDHFDQAPIFTIHGFCQRLLQEYALEQGQDFRAELVDDVDLLKAALHEIQRKHWRTEFGVHLRGVLEKACYNRETASEWERKVLDIACRYKPRSGHQLLPVSVPQWWHRLDEADANWVGQLEIYTIRTLHEYLRDFKRDRGLQSFDDMIASVEESLDSEKNSDADDFLNVLRQRFRFGIVDEFQDTDPLQWRIFRRIFLEGGHSKLIVVGDPKQAIFGFRGADLPTYLNAKDEMIETFGAGRYQLQENWRSEPDLLEGLNCLFQDGDWFPHASRIPYLPVHPPDDDKRLTRLEVDRTGRPALTIVDVTQWERLKVAQKQYARFVAHEVLRLLASGAEQPLASFSYKKSPPRSLNAGDICILIMKRLDAEPIMQALESAGIPFSFYKQTGLWQTDEALQLEFLLQTLVRPEDPCSFRKALLTSFFRVRPNELALCPNLPMHHPARQLYQTWVAYAEKRLWSSLFRSLLEDTGLLFNDAAFDSPSASLPVDTAERHLNIHSASTNSGPSDATPNSQRRLANFRQLLTALEQAGHEFNLDLLGVLEWIRQRRQQREAGEAGFQAAEFNRPKVKIMTIHASKGLEFPIVFLAGGFTQGRAGNVLASYRDDQGRVVFDWSPNNEAQERVSAELLSEHRRLLYVALTRSIFKLYVPKVKIGPRARQFAGPLGTILLPALDQACPDKLGSLIAETIVPPLSLSTSKPLGDSASRIAERTAITIKGPLFPAVDDQLAKRRIMIRSFSSMSRHLCLVGEGASFGDQIRITEDQVVTGLDREDPLRGAAFGDMVHKVLECIDFAEVARAAVPDDLIHVGTHARQRIDQAIKSHIAKLRTRIPISQLEQACRRQIAHHVWHSLHTPLSEIGGPLCEIPLSDRLTEVEFLLPERPGATLPADWRWEEGFITGYMDLLFRKRNMYYLVDWKTNLLPSYEQEYIARSMDEMDYHRQYQLYLQAIARWLRRVSGPAFHFDEHFGGVYYLYVRGMNGKDGSSGVFFHRPTERDLDLHYVLNR